MPCGKSIGASVSAGSVRGSAGAAGASGSNGSGFAVSVAAVDALIAYELVPGWRDGQERLRLLGGLCRWQTDLVRAGCPASVEVNVLRNGDKTAVTFFNHGAAPVEPFEFHLPLAEKPAAVGFTSVEAGAAELEFSYEDGVLTVRMPGFLYFAACRIDN